LGRRLRGPTSRALLAAGLGAAVLVDTRTLRETLPLMRVETAAEEPPVYAWLAAHTPSDAAILELPYGMWGDEAVYMVRSLRHGRRLFNGYSAAMPRFGPTLARFPDELSLRTLADAGVRYVIVHRDRYGGAGTPFVARIAARADLAPRAIGPDLVVEVPAAPVLEAAGGVELPRQGWRLTASEPGAERAADGDLASAWQAPSGSFLRVDLGHAMPVTAVVVRLGPRLVDYPHAYTVLASEDGMAWTPIGGEAPALPPFAAYRRNHRDVDMPLRVDARRTRFLEIRVPPYPRFGFTRNRWAVHELRILVAPGGY
jgi:hypothetical protein